MSGKIIVFAQKFILAFSLQVCDQELFVPVDDNEEREDQRETEVIADDEDVTMDVFCDADAEPDDSQEQQVIGQDGDQNAAHNDANCGEIGQHQPADHGANAPQDNHLTEHEALWRAIRNQQPFTSHIGTEVNNSPAEILLKLLAFSEQNNLSLKAFVDSVRLVNSLFVSPVIPGTQYLLDNLLLSSKQLAKYFYCIKCTYYFGKVNNVDSPEKLCPGCKTVNYLKDLTKATYFVLFPIESQLELLFMSKEVRDNLVHPKDAVRKNSERNSLKDIYDASLPDDLREKVLSLVFSTDGSPLFKSSSFSIWPCFFSINELPPLLRMKHLLLGGLWFGNKHPPMDLYLKPVVEYFESLLDTLVHLRVEGEEWLIKLYIIACCVDSGARGAVQGINSHSGYYSCNWCLIPGLWLDKVVFPMQEVPPAQRNHEDLVAHANECLNNDNLVYVYGVQFISPLASLKKFNLVDGMVQDFAHNVPFGIGRTFLDEWLHNAKRSFYVGSPDELAILNMRMEKLQPCIEVRRALRLLKDMAYWKAREFENWILFFSLIVLLSVLPMKFWTHWSYLVQAVYLLSRECVSCQDVNNAHRLIQLWVSDVEKLYGEKYMTYNVHIFSHLAENVARWGPTWAVSTYCFESAIGNLKNILHAQRGVPHQVHRNLSYKQAKHILINTCSTPGTEVFLESIKSKPNKMTKYLSLNECVVIGKGEDFLPNDEESFLISQCEEMQGDNFVTYSKIIASRCVYTCDSVALGKKFNNSVALTTLGKIIIIKKFIMSKENEKVWVFCSEASCTELLKFPQGLRIPIEDHCVRIISSVGRRLKLISVKELKI
ncbi:hypothetical protein FOCC_FOCC013225, partial [Frankliniella occidentalis]